MQKEQQEIKALLKKNNSEWPDGLRLVNIVLEEKLSREDIVIKWLFYNKPDTATGILDLIRNV